MRPPPPVAVRACGGPVWRGVQAALPALGVAVLKLWTLRLAELPMVLAAGAALALGAAVAAWGWRRHAPRPVDLRWDGACWTAASQPVQPAIALDLGTWMLLRLRLVAGPSPTTPWSALPWLAVSAAECGPAWHALRVALVATGGAAAPVADAAAGRPPPGG